MIGLPMPVKRWIVRSLADMCEYTDRLAAAHTCEMAKLSYALDRRWKTNIWKHGKGD